MGKRGDPQSEATLWTPSGRQRWVLGCGGAERKKDQMKTSGDEPTPVLIFLWSIDSVLKLMTARLGPLRNHILWRLELQVLESLSQAVSSNECSVGENTLPPIQISFQPSRNLKRAKRNEGREEGRERGESLLLVFLVSAQQGPSLDVRFSHFI